MSEEKEEKINVELTAQWIEVDGENVTIEEALHRIKAKDKKKRRLSEG